MATTVTLTSAKIFQVLILQSQELMKMETQCLKQELVLMQIL